MEVEHAGLLRWGFSLVVPGIMMVISAMSFTLAAILNPSVALSLNIKKLQSICFAMTWKTLGRGLSDDMPPAFEKVLDEKCHGKILDVGPGAGFQIKRFKGAYQAGRIQEIYGVEPGVEMHSELKAEAIKIFGGDAPALYKVLACGAQPGELLPALAKEGILATQTEGLFDTIVCIRVLCGIPQPQETVDLFYRLLKPGGTVIFLEHVVNSGSWRASGSILARLAQHAYMLLGWSFLAGGCELTRDTAATLRRSARVDGGWLQERVVDRKPEACIPEVWGYMTKRT